MPTTTANYTTARDNTKEDINVRSAGWCSDWPSGSTWLPPVLGSTNPDQDQLLRLELLGLQQQVGRQPDGRHPADAAGPAGRSVERPGQADRHRSTSRCSRPTTAASRRPTGRRSRATTTTTRSACRPGRTSGSPSDAPRPGVTTRTDKPTQGGGARNLRTPPPASPRRRPDAIIPGGFPDHCTRHAIRRSRRTHGVDHWSMIGGSQTTCADRRARARSADDPAAPLRPARMRGDRPGGSVGPRWPVSSCAASSARCSSSS